MAKSPNVNIAFITYDFKMLILIPKSPIPITNPKTITIIHLGSVS